MNPNEKALELVEKFTRSHWNMTSRPEIIKCALISVEEQVIEAKGYNSERESFWQSVKQELLKLK